MRSVPDWTRIQACSAPHFPHVSSFAFKARDFNSFSKFSCVRSGSFGGDLEDSDVLEAGFVGRAMSADVDLCCGWNPRSREGETNRRREGMESEPQIQAVR